MEIENLIDQKTRLKEGIFFTKPEIVDEIVNHFSFKDIERVIDSAAGSCNFLIPLAKKFPEIVFYGIEKNPLIYQETLQLVASIPNINYFLGDAILDNFPIPKCDIYIGNPPFINFSDLDSSYRELIKPIWLNYFPESKGFRMLLGDSRGDLSQLIYFHTVEKYLKEGGDIGVILPNSLIKGNSASSGFRSFKNMEIVSIRDIGDRNPFDNTKRNCFYILGKKGGETTYPIDYFTNNRIAKLVKSGGNLIEEGDSILGESQYKARQGVNTLGANSVFFFKKETPVNSELVYPLLKSSDIKPFSCSPTYKVLMPYSKEGKLIEEEELYSSHREVYNYLSQHKEKLQSRKSRFAKKSWYTLFGVGEYTFSEYMVIWRGLGAREMVACVATGVIPNQSMNCYIPCKSEEEAHYICGVMNSEIYRRELDKLNESGAKSFAQPTTINQIYIPKFDIKNSKHITISKSSQNLHLKIDTKVIEELNTLTRDIYREEKVWNS